MRQIDGADEGMRIVGRRTSGRAFPARLLDSRGETPD
jgi:hypothetical protein